MRYVPTPSIRISMSSRVVTMSIRSVPNPNVSVTSSRNGGVMTMKIRYIPTSYISITSSGGGRKSVWYMSTPVVRRSINIRKSGPGLTSNDMCVRWWMASRVSNIVPIRLGSPRRWYSSNIIIVRRIMTSPHIMCVSGQRGALGEGISPSGCSVANTMTSASMTTKSSGRINCVETGNTI